MLASEFSLLETIIKQSEHDSRRTIITLVEHNQAAKTLINDLRFYLPCKHTELIYFPDYETLAYETTKPNKQTE